VAWHVKVPVSTALRILGLSIFTVYRVRGGVCEGVGEDHIADFAGNKGVEGTGVLVLDG